MILDNTRNYEFIDEADKAYKLYESMFDCYAQIKICVRTLQIGISLLPIVQLLAFKQFIVFYF